MARLAGLEPATLGFEARYSIQLSYKRIANKCRVRRQSSRNRVDRQYPRSKSLACRVRGLWGR